VDKSLFATTQLINQSTLSLRGPDRFFLARIGLDSGVLPSSQPGEKEASKVYLSTKEIDAIPRLMVEDRINHLN
jgi:hypothetical protein